MCFYAGIIPLILFSESLFFFSLHALMWEAAMGTQPCHINMQTGEMLSPMLQSMRPAAVEAVANNSRYDRPR